MREGCHNTRGTKTWKNPVRSSRQGSHGQPTTGASVQPKQGGSETEGRGDQVAWKTKAWKSLEKCFRRGSQARATTVEIVLQNT